MDTRGDEPAWTTHARRIIPGQEIIVNRDDDDEEGDLGVRRMDTLTSDSNGRIREKIEEEDSGESSSSRTRQGEMIEMTDKRGPACHGSQASQASQGEAAEEGERWRSSGEESSDLANDPETQREVEEGMEEVEDKEGGGRRTPPLAKYREGSHLIVERKVKDSDEVCYADVPIAYHDLLMRMAFRLKSRSSETIFPTTRKRKVTASLIPIASSHESLTICFITFPKASSMLLHGFKMAAKMQLIVSVLG